VKVYKLVVQVIDFDRLGLQEAIWNLENGRFANRCIAPLVVSSEEKDIGEWYDDHPLNTLDPEHKAFGQIFGNS
jgi:hypothetical protein